MKQWDGSGVSFFEMKHWDGSCVSFFELCKLE